ncbi:cell wall protein [Aggregicoccus sp. 17bor-14]|uniref:cell wall protein n=1 Tax=Myxococcaceae TaxID=31 RepID=UPI00129C3A80|nr:MULTISPECIES: cell wall protein [Myxococcaceae]MBF5045388.1 cell wall protein [Simulacricoccus sp. 17bor-14]MRI91129.1 cell wall protein [Aggregicoccus sp. 17bor-14]
MSVDKAFREMIRNEIEVQLKPLRDVVSRLEEGSADLDALRDVAERLMPFAEAMGPLFGAVPGAGGARGGRAGQGGAALARRGPGRPRGSGKNVLAAGGGAGGARRGRKPGAAAAAGAAEGARACAIIDCQNPARTKGYCAAHYQKLRMLVKTDRKPAAWAEYAPPHSVPDLVLPRGRAASKALKERQGGSAQS